MKTTSTSIAIFLSALLGGKTAVAVYEKDSTDGSDKYTPALKCSDAPDCDSCLSTSSKCTWFQDIGYCQEGCGMDGCGATVCAADIIKCKDCLGGDGTPASGQYSWSPYTNECVEDCMWAPADAPCYKAKSSVDPRGYGPSFCNKISNPPTPSPIVLPIKSCSEGYDCESCLSNLHCTWFEDIGHCQKGCGMDGCGATVCAADLTTCKKCLGGDGTPASGQYSWSPYTNECVEDCMWAPADAPCYKAKSSVDPSGYGPSICDKINEGDAFLVA